MAAEFYAFNGDTTLFTDHVDSWSLGCILYRVITGADIFPNILTMVKHFNSGQPSLREGLVTEGLSETGISFIESLLHKNPEDRLSATDALEHHWLDLEEAHWPSESLKEKLKLHMAIDQNTQNYMYVYSLSVGRARCVAPLTDTYRPYCSKACVTHYDVCPSIPGSTYIPPTRPDDSAPIEHVDQEPSPVPTTVPFFGHVMSFLRKGGNFLGKLWGS